MANLISLVCVKINGSAQTPTTGTTVGVSPATILQTLPKSIAAIPGRAPAVNAEVRVQGLRKQCDVYLVTSTVAQIITAANA